MRLCFGIFAAILNCCKENILQADLIARIARCVDEYSNYINTDYRYEESWEIKGDDAAVSKLLSCERGFVFSNGSTLCEKSLVAVIENIDIGVTPVLNEDQKPKIIFAILDVIRKDPSIETNRREAFKKCFGMEKYELLKKSEFDFSDFLGRTLFFVSDKENKNTNGKPFVKNISRDYINRTAESFMNEYCWDQARNRLTLSFHKIFETFQSALQEYAMDQFISECDPTCLMELSRIEKAEDFVKFIPNNVLQSSASFAVNTAGETIQKIQGFAQILDEYLEYLGKNMRPIAERPTIFVPMYRDENMEWALVFGSGVQKYRQELISIYGDIYKHMLFSESSPPNEKNGQG